MKLIFLFFISSLSWSDTKSETLICEKLLNQQHEITEIDRLLFKKSRTTFVSSGAAKATAENAKQDRSQLLHEGDSVNHWFAYFIGDLYGCFASAEHTMDGLNKRMNELAQKMANNGKINMPVHIFFMCSDAHYVFSTPSGNQYPIHNVYSRNQNLLYSRQQSLVLQVEEGVLQYQFHVPSAVAMIGGGDKYHPSFWDDDFTLARELSSISSQPLLTPKYYREAVASFRAYQLTGKTKPGEENELDISNPFYKSLYSFFEDGHSRANNFQMATMYANFLYKLSQYMAKMKLEAKLNPLLQRIEDLVGNAYSSQNNDRSITDLKHNISYSEAQARQAFNYLTSSFIQASIEQRLPFELTEWICAEWEWFGVKGPFKRHRIYDPNSKNGKRLAKSEENYNFILLRDKWMNCDDLSSFSKPRHLPLYQ